MKRGSSRRPQRTKLPGTTGNAPAGGYYPPLRAKERTDPDSAPAPRPPCRGGYQPPAARCLYRVPHMRRGPSRCPRRAKLPGTTGHTPGGRILSVPTRQRKDGPGQCVHSASSLQGRLSAARSPMPSSGPAHETYPVPLSPEGEIARNNGGRSPGGRIVSAPTHRGKGGPGQCARSASSL